MTASGSRQQGEDPPTGQPVSVDRECREGEQHGEQNQVQASRPGAEPDQPERECGERGQAGEARERRPDHAKREPAIPPHIPLLRRVGGERPVLERETIASAATGHRVPGLRVLGEGQDFIAVRTAHPVGQGCGPAAVLLMDPERMASTVRALHQVSRPDARR